MGPPIADSVPLFIVLGILIVVAAFFAAAEAALLRVPRVRLEVAAERGDRSAARLARLVSDLPRVINSVLLLVLLVQVGAATVAGVIAERHFGNTGVTIVSVLLTLVMFVYAEAIPKTLAVRHPLTVARVVALPVWLLARVTRPIVALLLLFADLQSPGKGIPSRATVNELELRRLAEEAAAAGEIEPSDLDLIERSFRVGDRSVAEIMIPRPDVVAVPGTMDAARALEIALESGHRRLPVCHDDLDEVTGVVRLRDLARAIASGASRTAADLQRPPVAVPETNRVIEVLRAMQEASQYLAIVVDEHGGTAGIVTIEDAVEELVGEVTDADRPARPELQRLGPGHWSVDGGLPVTDLAAEIGSDLPEGNWLTVAGLVIGLAGRIPDVDEAVEIPGFVLRVAEASRRRVRRIEVTAER
jgi:CBS domain containing-hemolysin-like protein